MQFNLIVFSIIHIGTHFFYVILLVIQVKMVKETNLLYYELL